MDEGERKRLQRTARDSQMSDIERSLANVSQLIKESQREIQRSRGLLQGRREQNARDDKADDAATG
jgi:hypothetical protein